MVSLTLLGIVVATLTAFIFWKQFAVMESQLSEMRSSSKQTDELIRLYQEQIRAMGETSKATRRVGAATQSLAATALEADSPHLGPRVETSGRFLQGQPLSVTLTITNTGKRPAYILQFIGTSHVYDDFPAQPEFLQNEEYNLKKGRIQPSQSVLVQGSTTSVTWTASLLTPEAVDRIKARETLLYVYGSVTYSDAATKQIHTDHICYFYSPNQDTFNFCPFYNSAS
jgi:hypothetical protein